MLENRLGDKDQGICQLNLRRICWISAVMAICSGLLVKSGVNAEPAQKFPAIPEAAASKTEMNRFEVASIRRVERSASAGVGRGGALGGACSGSPPAITPGRIVFSSTSIFKVIAWAYDLKCGDASKLGLISGEPPWARSDQFVIQATFPANSDVRPPAFPGVAEPRRYPQIQMMFRNLLVERFNLAIHREKKEVSIYELVVAKGGPKLSGQPNSEALKRIQGLGAQVIQLGNAPMSILTTFLQDMTGRSIVDRTGLAGEYPFGLYYAGIEESPPDSQFPPLVTALQEQLGLKLQGGKSTEDAVIIDHIEKPVD